MFANKQEKHSKAMMIPLTMIGVNYLFDMTKKKPIENFSFSSSSLKIRIFLNQKSYMMAIINENDKK